MEIDFYTQTTAFAYSLLIGVIIGAAYEIFKFIRLAFLRSRAAIMALDITFMIFASLTLYFYSLAAMYGYVRVYMVIGALIGFFAFRFSLGRLISMVYCPIIKAVSSASQKIISKFKKFTRKLLKISNNILYNINKKIYELKNKHKGLSVKKRVKASNEKSE